MKLLDRDLLTLLRKKRSLLAEWFHLAQKQIPLVNSTELDKIFDQKDQCIEQLKQTDAAIVNWHGNHERTYTSTEESILRYIEIGLKEISEVEEEFENLLLKEKAALNAELGQLGHQRQLRSYLGNQNSSGKNLSFRR